MSHVWLLLQRDAEDVAILGVYTTRDKAEAALEALWSQYQQLTPEQRMLVGAYVLRLTESVTRESFLRWHTITDQGVDVVPTTYEWKEPVP